MTYILICKSVYSRKEGVDLYLHTFVMWASDWRWIEQTLNSHRSPSETEVFLSLFSLYVYVYSDLAYVVGNISELMLTNW